MEHSFPFAINCSIGSVINKVIGILWSNFETSLNSDDLSTYCFHCLCSKCVYSFLCCALYNFCLGLFVFGSLQYFQVDYHQLISNCKRLMFRANSCHTGSPSSFTLNFNFGLYSIYKPRTVELNNFNAHIYNYKTAVISQTNLT